MSSSMTGAIPEPWRWSRYGARRIYLGQQARRGELVVTGRGEVSHKDLTCPALRAGRNRAIANGWRAGGFYAVSVALADLWVGRCRVCLRDSTRTVESNQPPRRRPAKDRRMRPLRALLERRGWRRHLRKPPLQLASDRPRLHVRRAGSPCGRASVGPS